MRREESYGTTYIEASKQTLGDFRPVCAAMESDNGIYPSYLIALPHYWSVHTILLP